MITYPNFVVNTNTESVARSRRFSETIVLSRNEVLERQRQGIWLDVNLSIGADQGNEDDEDQEEDNQMKTFKE